MTSLRLPRDLAIALDRLADERRTTRSQLIREAVEALVDAARSSGPEDRASLVRKLVTYEGSGRGDLAARGEEHLRHMFDARRRRSSR